MEQNHDEGLYDSNNMPLSNDSKKRKAQEKYLREEELTIQEKIAIGRNRTVKSIDGYNLKSNCVYRAINKRALEFYNQSGFVYGTSIDDEYIEYEDNGNRFNNNRGVDWYLGGVSLKYGDIVIECPADKRYFVPASDNGNGMAVDPSVKHMKSSGYKNPVPMSMTRIVKSPVNIPTDELNLDGSFSRK